MSLYQGMELDDMQMTEISLESSKNPAAGFSNTFMPSASPGAATAVPAPADEENVQMEEDSL